MSVPRARPGAAMFLEQEYGVAIRAYMIWGYSGGYLGSQQAHQRSCYRASPAAPCTQKAGAPECPPGAVLAVPW